MLFRMSAIILHKLLSLNRNIFQDLSLSMTKFQPSVAYKSVAYKIKRVLNQKRVYCSVLLFEIQYLKNGMPYEDGHFDRI